MDPLRVWTLGDQGVNRVKNPQMLENDELLQAQNAAEYRRGGRHALSKRPGMSAFTDVLDGQLLGLIVGGITLPPSPASNVAPPYDPDSSATPYGNVYAAFLDLVYMRVRLYLTAATTAIVDNTPTAVEWTAEEYDVGALHDLVATPDRVTVPNAGDGLYLVLGQAKWATSASGKKRGVAILKNGAAQNAHEGAADDDGDGLTQQCVAILNLVAGDYVQMQVEQDTGGGLDLLGGTVDETSLLVIRLIQTVNVPVPRVHAYKSGAQILTHDTPAIVNFDAEAIDNLAMHDNVTNNSRVTAPAQHDGLYLVVGHYSFAHPLVGHITIELLKNGTTVLAETKVNGINAIADRDITGQITGAFELIAGDYMELRATVWLATLGGTHNLLGGSLLDSSLFMSRIG